MTWKYDHHDKDTLIRLLERRRIKSKRLALGMLIMATFSW